MTPVNVAKPLHEKTNFSSFLILHFSIYTDFYDRQKYWGGPVPTPMDYSREILVKAINKDRTQLYVTFAIIQGSGLKTKL